MFLPKQIPLAEFAAALPKLADPAHPLPVPVKQALAGLLAALPNPGRLATAEGLTRALGDAGIWFEARLARALDRGGDFPAGDFKGLLLTVLDRLDAAQPATGASAPPTETAGRPANTPETAPTTGGTDPSPLDALARKVEGALARIGLDQLAALPQPDGTQSWSVAIPYAQGEQSDTLRIRIDAEAQHDGADTAATPHWSVNLELKPPGLGTVSARLVLAGGKIDTYLWSDTANTAGLLRDHGDWLRARLEGAGLAVGHLDTLEQAPAAPARSPVPAAPLLDIKA
ncbi:hook-length control protein FliK [Methylomagnum ishizawai]|uniref:Hook-length control protein FliK n=1 Tax=Methylomagnum ishizawai TaxID=1760988 RepID=A0A1Y6D2D6_9GAMM|nr:flagellar hook-length control protein FliK [Methylomagnum ishizawai]SMF96797.1 hook-length control protein FliK [Methylomagnum ishizawai]